MVMTRLIPHTARGPLKVLKADLAPGDAVYLCRCGLSANPNGFCDGSHKATTDEQPGNVYLYERQGRQLVRTAATFVPAQVPTPSTPSDAGKEVPA